MPATLFCHTFLRWWLKIGCGGGEDEEGDEDEDEEEEEMVQYLEREFNIREWWEKQQIVK